MPSTSRSRGSGRGPDGAPRTQNLAPMSERQQLALVMQLQSQDAPPATPTTTPAEERKRNRQHRNERGETPLHVAAIRGDHDQVKKLLEQGQEPDVPDFAGWTPLHEACSYGWFQVVEVLVKGGAKVNAKGLDDDTPLHDAATSGNLKLVKFLIEHGADPFVKNTKGKMPSDYAAPHIFEYLQSLKDNNVKGAYAGRARDESSKKFGNASNSDSGKRGTMDCLAQGDHFEGKESVSQDKGNSAENKDEANQITSNVVSSSQDDTGGTVKRLYFEEGPEAEVADDDVSKKKKRKENDDNKEPMAKPAPVSRSGPGRVLTGTKPPGPASKTGVAPLNKSGNSQSSTKGSQNNISSSKGGLQSQGKGPGGKINAQNTHQGKSSGSSKVSSSQMSKQERKSPVPSPKSNQSKDSDDIDDQKTHESAAPKVPPLKIVIPGGAAGAANRSEQEEGSGQRGSGKGRGGVNTLPYVLSCTGADPGPASDSSDGAPEDKRTDFGKAGQRVLRSHRTNDGEKERSSPQRGTDRSGAGQSQSALNTNKSPTPSGSGQDYEHPTPSTSGTSESRRETTAFRTTHRRASSSLEAHTRTGQAVDLHPRKRKIKSSKESHSRESRSDPSKDSLHESVLPHHVQHSNPYQMYIHIRKQIDRRQRALFPVKPKPPKDFAKYLMNRCTYTLQSNVNPEYNIDIPANLPQPMVDEFISQEEERRSLRTRHTVGKEKLVLSVEQEILRVHGRAERAVANQALPYSASSILRNNEVYNVLAPEQEEKRNAQRSRCNGRQINSWLQEVDDKWEKIKESVLRIQHMEAETLHAVQLMSWEWKLKELGLCDLKTSPKIETSHVPQVHVSNFDLPA